MQNPGQEPPASSKAQNQDLKDSVFLALKTWTANAQLHLSFFNPKLLCIAWALYRPPHAIVKINVGSFGHRGLTKDKLRYELSLRFQYS